ncbi:MAG: amino acid permease-associated protein [Deltaproteobacteria bacterium]|nr:amino acid permease [Deltaproteobacteria bacterium]RLA89523.1 MAG: amino acid permease-associated protein [Deltaproteobacteria bacterium]
MGNGEKHLRKELGILGVTAITAGIVIGAGVFIVTGIAAKYAGAWTWVSYAIGAVPVILVGLSTVMLNLMYPVEGGESYVYPTRIVNNYAGFLSGWAMWLALIGPVAITAKAFIMYVNALPGLETKLNIVVGGVVVTIVFFMINWIGIKTVKIIQNILFLFMVGGLLIYIILGLPHLNIEYITMPSPKGFSGIWKGASLLIFAYAGLTLAADLGEEAKDPAKTISWGIALGIIIPAILYIASAFVSTGVIPWKEFASSNAPYATVASKYMGAFGVTFIIVVAWAAILSSHNAEQTVGARILFGTSRDKILPKIFASINRFGVPGNALILTAAVAIFLIISGTIQLVAEIVVAMFLYNWIITHIAVLMAPKTQPELFKNAPMKLNGWKAIFPIAGIIISVALLIYQGPKALIYSAVWLAIGSIFYFVGYFSKKEEVDKLINEWPRDRYY